MLNCVQALAGHLLKPKVGRLKPELFEFFNPHHKWWSYSKLIK